MLEEVITLLFVFAPDRREPHMEIEPDRYSGLL